MTDPLDLASWRRLLSLEEAAGRARFDELRARLDPAGRIGAGLAVGGLVVADAAAGTLGRASWRLEPKEGELGPEPTAGDPVRVYRRRTPEEAVRGLVARRTRRAITVVFEEPPDEAFESAELVVEREWDEKTHGRLVKGLARLESAAKGRDAFWRGLVTGEKSPGEVRAEASADPNLNDRQNEALARAMGAPDVFLVHGPPGTGKTEVLAAIAEAELARGGTVLACAASNAAVDNLVIRCAARGLDPVRLGHPARVLPAVVDSTLEAKARAHPDAEVAERLVREARELMRRADRAARQGRAADRFSEARQARFEARRLFGEARGLARRAESDVLERAKVVCATLTGLGTRLGARRFSLVIVDEATQATVPATILGLLAADRVVLAGDQHQLSPTVLSREAAKQGLATTLYERLYAAHGDAIATMLEVQHRMHAEIMAFPSAQSYAGRLVAHPSVAGHTLSELAPVLFVDTAGKGWSEERPEGSESLRNAGEAERLVKEVEALKSLGVGSEQMGVIAPYAAQVELLRTMLPDEALEIDSVDAFQGREKDAILVSLVRSNDTGDIGFLSDVRRMNVALTRARKRLVVVGDSATVGGHPYYAAFVEHVQARGAYRSAWEE